MKVITRCVIDWESIEVVEQESFEYSGSVAECKGGGSSGTVAYPDYMEAAHEDWLTEGGTDTIEKSITEVMNAAIGSSPIASAVAYNPATLLATSRAAVTTFESILAAIGDDDAVWSTLHTSGVTAVGAPATLAAVTSLSVTDAVAPSDLTYTPADEMDDSDVDDDSDALGDLLDDEISTKVLPRFHRGMQDINAVTSSAFAIGDAIIEAFRDRDVAKHNSAARVALIDKNLTVRVQNKQIDSDISKANLSKAVAIVEGNLNKAVEVGKVNLLKDVEISKGNLASTIDFKKMYLEAANQMSRQLLQRIAFHDSVSKTSVEEIRIQVVAHKEEVDTNREIDKEDALWDLEVFQYGGNLLAAASGGTTQPQKPSKAASAIGGALSGAAVGSMIAPGIGTAIGAAVGALGGLLS